MAVMFSSPFWSSSPLRTSLVWLEFDRRRISSFDRALLQDCLAECCALFIIQAFNNLDLICTSRSINASKFPPFLSTMKRSSLGSATLLGGTQSSDSLYSFSTVTSTSTFAGPGSLAGKAIHNFGKLTLKGIEQIIISRRLSSIATHFPHRNSNSFAGFPEMYSDLLELSR
ncbi:hypothetical protein BT96DRAFT_1022346 [Gymnopus androsaceus JB14]|uniref:Uncharacterized protein n=1 Tax=Gymnopus androsaceus JB14 TaxID=1447944 RepID=A0A6A4HBX8_9AGAR|nr:hypothetical protein BT96DRAFT_1022346 [Gymnopus androsaceus JB14]